MMKQSSQAMSVAALLLLMSSAAGAAAQNVSPARDAVAQPRCSDGERVGSRGCATDAYLVEILDRDGVEGAMAALDRLIAVDGDVRRDAHGLAHAIGIAAYTGAEDVGRVFARCTPAHQSGCYHGVIQSYFTLQMREDGGHLDAGLVNALCSEQREDPEERWLLFQCAHGMGHGLTMVADRHLPTALEGCDLLQDEWEREACYGGVFMENIVHETVPHHAVGRPDAVTHADHRSDPPIAPDAAAHSNHGAAVLPAASREEFPPLERDDPLYPCTVLADRYLPACYQMQTSAVLHFNGRDVRAAGRVCMTAPELFRTTCFQSLGRDVSALTGQDHTRAIRLCASAPDEYEPWCHIGYAKNLIDLTADASDGLAYCRQLPEGEAKQVCYVAVGEQIWVLTEAPQRRASMCGTAEANYVDACRFGAGLLPESAAAAPAAGSPATE